MHKKPVQDAKTQPSLKELLLTPTPTDIEIPKRGTHRRRPVPSVTQNHHLLIDNNIG